MSSSTSVEVIGREREVRTRLGYSAIEPLYMLVNFCIIVFCSIVTGSLSWLAIDRHIGDLSTHVRLGIVAASVYLPISHALGLNRFETLLRMDIGKSRILVAWISMIVIVSVCLVILRADEPISYGALMFFALLGLFGIVFSRHLSAQTLRAAVANGAIAGKAAIIIGTHEELSRLSSVKLLTTFGFSERKRFTLPPHSKNPSEVSSIVSSALSNARGTAADEIVLAIPWANKS